VFGTLMGGTAVTPKPGLNPVEVLATMLRLMQAKVIDIKQTGGVGTPQDVIGLNHSQKYCEAFLKMLEADKGSVNLVRMFAGELGTLANETKAFMQRQAEAAKQKQQQGNGGPSIDPKDVARVEGMKLQAQTKAQIAKESHAARTAQKQLSWEQQLKQKREDHAADLQAKDLEVAATIGRNRLTSLRE
jgi:hypothetical protein